ncbi:Type IV fimbrial biogenesis protein PilY1 [Labilithrix luteola]|uniref:Type IV fimbrial biogenesis protein PilY1 n=2 Tax=Labilithrix luteola TaxID=1391654 RepID=A0A0K1PW25_9BACT|nr:Type IV fimbrial biogenesis protein PilY1 [Labilithrix luteola]
MRARYTTMTVLAAGALVCALASCATTDETAPNDPPKSILDASAPDSADAVASDADAETPVSCDDVAWCPVATNVSAVYALTAVWGSSKNDVWASGSGGSVIHWDGAAWMPTPLPTLTGVPVKNTFRALWGSGPNDVWVASATDLIFHSEGFKNGTAGWKATPAVVAASSVPIYAAWGSGAGDVRFGSRSYYFSSPEAAFLANQIVKQPAGAEAEWSASEGTAIVYGLWGSSADDLWLIGDNRAERAWQPGLTMHGTRQEKGLFWTEVDSRASVVLRGIWGSSKSDVWTVGDQGTIRRFGPNATEWAIIESPTRETLHAVWGSSATDVWAVGESGTILHWDGTTWSASTAAFSNDSKKPNLYGVWGSGPSDVWIVGEGIALHYTGNVGGSK